MPATGKKAKSYFLQWKLPSQLRQLRRWRKPMGFNEISLELFYDVSLEAAFAFLLTYLPTQ